jgi:hypothetical protein
MTRTRLAWMGGLEPLRRLYELGNPSFDRTNEIPGGDSLVRVGGEFRGILRF